MNVSSGMGGIPPHILSFSIYTREFNQIWGGGKAVGKMVPEMEPEMGPEINSEIDSEMGPEKYSEIYIPWKCV